MSLKIALAGNPNCGKTTLFNNLTGGNEYVGNWPGVTVEKKNGDLKGYKDIVLQDLPGIYSLSPYTLEEVVTRQYLVDERPDAIINIVDGTNIERNLYLTTQLLELNIPMVIALNMMDLVTKNGDEIDIEKLAKALGCEVMPISALEGNGCKELAAKAVSLAQEKKVGEHPHVFTGAVEHAIAHIEESIQEKVDSQVLRWFAVKLFERDEKALEKLALPKEITEHLEKHVVECENELEDDSESIITNQRYAYVKKVTEQAVRKKQREGNLTLSDKIDKVVTNRVLALPIFAVVIWFMYWISVSTIGTWLTDWANDGVFGDGWHFAFTADSALFTAKEVKERNAAALKEFEARKAAALKAGEKFEEEFEPETWESVSGAFDDAQKRIETWQAAYTKAYEEKHPAAEGENKEEEEFEVQDTELAKTVKATAIFEDEESGEIDHEEEVTYEQYLEDKKVEEPNPSLYGLWIPGVPSIIGGLLDKIGIHDGSFLYSLIINGIVAGVGTVFGFLPQILIVFLFLAFMEDCGYMARVAFIMDRIFRRFGLSGKSFIPMLVGTGCGVPAVMATRTIENLNDRRMTILLATFIPCGAKVAIIAMIVAAFFPGSNLVGPSMYFVGIAIVVFGGIALKKTKTFAGEAAPFVMELPAYHWPSLKGVFIHTWERGKAYAIKAGTIIFAACIVLYFLMSFDWHFHLLDPETAEGLEQCMLHDIGQAFAWIFKPLGFGNWQGTVACVSAEIAKEQATATLAMLAPDVDGGTLKGVQTLFAQMAPANLEPATQALYAKIIAFSFMVCNLFFPPCLVAIATTWREMGSAKWGCIAIGFQLMVGYIIALFSYQFGVMLFAGAGVGAGQIIAILVLLAVLYFIFRPMPKFEEVKK
ncbi:MAG: ferrous iron transporter B [Victivallales bacterium]|nr:ferrous iron transporter B [Victivallales bacterium]